VVASARRARHLARAQVCPRPPRGGDPESIMSAGLCMPPPAAADIVSQAAALARAADRAEIAAWLCEHDHAGQIGLDGSDSPVLHTVAFSFAQRLLWATAADRPGRRAAGQCPVLHIGRPGDKPGSHRPQNQATPVSHRTGGGRCRVGNQLRNRAPPRRSTGSRTPEASGGGTSATTPSSLTTKGRPDPLEESAMPGISTSAAERKSAQHCYLTVTNTGMRSLSPDS
jgi:hypothetical protein